MLKLNLPKTTTKAQWKEAYRWLRQVNKIMEAKRPEIEAEVGRRMTNLMVYGVTHPEAFVA